MIEHLQQTPTPPSRVVVLGASGFVGNALINHLTELNVETIPISSADIDLCELAAVNSLRDLFHKEDVVVFVSALTPDKGKDIRTLMKNLAMGEHVSEALNETPCSHVIYLSSDAVYADDLDLIGETSPCNPTSFHGLMHLARERMLSIALAESQIPLLILRPSLLYGANDTHNSYGPNRFLRIARETGTIALFGEGEEKRDHVYVEDVAAMVGLGLSHKSRGILNIATGTSTSFLNVAQAVVESLGEKVDIQFQPRTSPIVHCHFDNTLTHRAFPSFSYTSLADGMAETTSR